MTPIHLADKLTQFDATWTPHVIAELNGQQVKLAKLEGAFVWHDHADEDELFWVVSGRLRIEFRDAPDAVLGPGEIVVVPRGVEHRPVAEHEALREVERADDVVGLGHRQRAHGIREQASGGDGRGGPVRACLDGPHGRRRRPSGGPRPAPTLKRDSTGRWSPGIEGAGRPADTLPDSTVRCVSFSSPSSFLLSGLDRSGPSRRGLWRPCSALERLQTRRGACWPSRRRLGAPPSRSRPRSIRTGRRYKSR